MRRRQRRFEGLDEKIPALYSRGLSTRDVEAHLAEIYGVKVGRELISRVTDAVIERLPLMAAATTRRRVSGGLPRAGLKIRVGGTVQRRALYLALAIAVDGDRDVLGMWFEEPEGAKVWMQVLSELKQRGVSAS